MNAVFVIKYDFVKIGIPVHYIPGIRPYHEGYIGVRTCLPQRRYHGR